MFIHFLIFSIAELADSAPPSAGILAAQDVAGASGKAARKLGPMGPMGPNETGPQGKWWNFHGSVGKIGKQHEETRVFKFQTLILGGPRILLFNQFWDTSTTKPRGEVQQQSCEL